ncbi:MAG: hypothetical protein ABEI86_13215, partial [Halobacteriaceae archaeon]
ELKGIATQDGYYIQGLDTDLQNGITAELAKNQFNALGQVVNAGRTSGEPISDPVQRRLRDLGYA